MKKASAIEDDLQEEYDFSKLTRVGRGIYAGGRRLSPDAVKALNEGSPTVCLSVLGKDADFVQFRSTPAGPVARRERR